MYCSSVLCIIRKAGPNFTLKKYTFSKLIYIRNLPLENIKLNPFVMLCVCFTLTNQKAKLHRRFLNKIVWTRTIAIDSGMEQVPCSGTRQLLLEHEIGLSFFCRIKVCYTTQPTLSEKILVFSPLFQPKTSATVPLKRPVSVAARL